MAAAALGGLVAGASLAGAESPRPDTSPHLLVVPDSARGELALARADARVVARYDDFSLVEATGDDVTACGAPAPDGATTCARWLLAGGHVDPARRPSLAAKDAPDRGEALVLVQFVGPVKDEWLAKLRATGATVLGYAAQNGYIVHAAGDALDRVTELVGSYPAVRAATALRSGDKVERGADERPRGRPDRGWSPRCGRPRRPRRTRARSWPRRCPPRRCRRSSST